MPYINKAKRAEFAVLVDDMARAIENASGLVPGDLNYLFTQLAIAYLERMGLNYTYINDVIGALEASKMEVYRRVAIPYEIKKIMQEGDVYPRKLTRRVERTDVQDETLEETLHKEGTVRRARLGRLGSPCGDYPSTPQAAPTQTAKPTRSPYDASRPRPRPHKPGGAF